METYQPAETASDEREITTVSNRRQSTLEDFLLIRMVSTKCLQNMTSVLELLLSMLDPTGTVILTVYMLGS